MLLVTEDLCIPRDTEQPMFIFSGGNINIFEYLSGKTRKLH